MIFGFIALILLLVLMIIAIRIGINKEKTEIGSQEPTIHTSGVYSVVRKSPREDLLRKGPSPADMREYLEGINEDINGHALDRGDKEILEKHFRERLEASIAEIESGDKNGVAFYFLCIEGEDPVCSKYIAKGIYLTREDIYRHGELVPPFHLGCTCCIKRYHGGEVLRDTTEIGLQPFIKKTGIVPALPNWRTTVRIDKTRTGRG